MRFWHSQSSAARQFPKTTDEGMLQCATLFVRCKVGNSPINAACEESELVR